MNDEIEIGDIGYRQEDMGKMPHGKEMILAMATPRRRENACVRFKTGRPSKGRNKQEGSLLAFCPPFLGPRNPPQKRGMQTPGQIAFFSLGNCVFSVATASSNRTSNSVPVTFESECELLLEDRFADVSS